MNPAEAYILNQDEPFRSILMHLQVLIEATIPEVALKYKWNLPFFYIDKTPCCYLNVPKKKAYVDLCFWNSAHLTKHTEHLTTANRRIIKSLRIHQLEDIQDNIVIEILQDAYTVRDKKFLG